MKKKILIIGGTGFLGYNFAKKCLDNNLLVTSLSRSEPNKLRLLKKINYIYCDIQHKKKLHSKLNENFNYVVNFGGEVDHHSKNTYRSHYIGCKNLVDYFKKTKIEKFVQIGSSVEYGKLKSPHKEKNIINDINRLDSTYAKAKLKSSLYVLNQYKRKKFPGTIFRIYLAYGPGQDLNRVIPFTILNCLKNNSFKCSDGNQYRDFVFIDDVVEVLFRSLKKKKTNGEIFNICKGRPINIKKTINDIKIKTKGGHPEFGKIKLRKDEVKIYYGSILKTKKFFNWKPKIDLNVGISKTIKYYENYLKKRNR